MPGAGSGFEPDAAQAGEKPDYRMSGALGAGSRRGAVGSPLGKALAQARCCLMQGQSLPHGLGFKQSVIQRSFWTSGLSST